MNEVTQLHEMSEVPEELLFPDVNARMQSIVPKNARTFIGNGTNKVSTPGLVEIEAVYVGEVYMPLYEERPVIVSTAENALPKIQRVHLVKLVQMPDGPAIQRSIVSNDGIWQDGIRISVVGKWSDGKSAKKAQPDTQEPKEEEDNPTVSMDSNQDEDLIPASKDAAELGRLLDRMNLDPLRELAVKAGVSIKGDESKKEVINAIIAFKYKR